MEGGSFNSNFLHRYLMNLTVKKYENWSTFAEFIVKISGLLFRDMGMPLSDGVKFDDMCILLSTKPECDGQTNRQTEKQRIC